jgi:hypothetical protein
MDVERAGAHAVLLEGGTMPRLSWRPSAAMEAIGRDWGRLDPGPPPAWADTLRRGRHPVDGADEVAAGGTASQAVRFLLTNWVEAWSSRHPAALVGLGYAEVDGLNQAARALLVEQGGLQGPQVVCGGRVFQPGDRVLALRRLAPDLAPGTAASIVEVDPRRRTARVAWDGGNAVLDRTALDHAGYAYALTPGLAARTGSPLLVLGPADVTGPHRARVLGAAQVERSAQRGAQRGRRQERGTTLGIA